MYVVGLWDSGHGFRHYWDLEHGDTELWRIRAFFPCSWLYPLL